MILKNHRNECVGNWVENWYDNYMLQFTTLYWFNLVNVHAIIFYANLHVIFFCALQ